MCSFKAAPKLYCKYLGLVNAHGFLGISPCSGVDFTSSSLNVESLCQSVSNVEIRGEITVSS